MLIRDVIRDREGYSLKSSATVMEAAEFMAQRRIGAVCVMDEQGRLMGVFSERDLLNRVVVPRLEAGNVATSASAQPNFKAAARIRNLHVPWSLVWALMGRMLFTPRPGPVHLFENGKLRPEPLFTLPDVEPRGESGLMSIALHPQV